MPEPPKRILVVDDEPHVLQSFSRRLRIAGYTVDTALTAKQALALCEERPYDLVVLDLMMPVVSGVELLAKIRAKKPLIRSIIISGQVKERITEVELNQRLKDSVAADRYLDKPVSAKQLTVAVEQLLNGSSADWITISREVTNSPKITLKKAKETAKEIKALKDKK